MTQKNINEISAIIENMEETLFEKINNADYEAWDSNTKIRKNAKKRLAYNLKKCGLTLDDWYAWCDL